MKLKMILAACLMSTAAVAQTDPIIMTINGVPVPRSEFEYSYNKNNGADVIDKKTVDEYVDLFINYKLKVAVALDAHYDTLSSFKQEYTMYRDQQVRPTMATDADVLVEAKKVYDRAKEQIGPRGLILPAHILIRVSTQATQGEQDKAKQRIDSVYKALRGGADFADLAKKVSDDKSKLPRHYQIQKSLHLPELKYQDLQRCSHNLAPYNHWHKELLQKAVYHLS
jgi:peptidyl-prolyl cis-trans isomerase SurA